MSGFDRVLGNSYVNQPWYSKGQKALELEPNSLTFFELIILAQTVHEFAHQYSTLEKNCYWFCNMVFHACKVIYGQRSQDGDNPHWHHSEILGCWNDLKVSQTERTELWVIVYEFNKKFAKAISKVKIVF
jgi:hypothetical protein